MLADHLGEFEAVQAGHANVHQDDGDVMFEEMLQSLGG